jgi:hypothetical protein
MLVRSWGVHKCASAVDGYLVMVGLVGPDLKLGAYDV